MKFFKRGEQKQKHKQKVKRSYLSSDKLELKRQLATQRPTFSYKAADDGRLPCMSSVKSQVRQVYDQGAEGSCTANAYCAAYCMLCPDKTFNPSRQYVYWKERFIENHDNPDNIHDSGANVADGITYVSQHGVCSEISWPYDVSKVDVEPPASCDTEAESHRLGTLNSITIGDNNSIKKSIMYGIPVMIAMAVYQSFDSSFTAQTGIVKMPNPIKYGDPKDAQDAYLGGHELLIVGYQDFPGYFTILN